MKALTWMLILGLCIALSPGCRGRPGIPVSRNAPSYSNIVAVADGMVSKTLLLWHAPREVWWQPAPLSRYAVTYPIDYDHHVEVYVYTNSGGGLAVRGGAEQKD
jgi:hypothetical protein